MTNVIGNVFCEQEKVTWEVWTDGKAFSDHYNHIAAYRWPNGEWRQSPVLPTPAVKASSKIELMYERFVSGIITDPIDPHRHLRKK